jgi:GNAT superfamily N-acetyltransferase
VSIKIRDAALSDVPLILSLVRELAEYEKLSAEVDATEEAIAAILFNPRPLVFCDIGEWDGQPAGFAISFLNFSSFRGRHGVYLEDLFVRPQFRRKGIGKALMQRLARRCVKEGWVRFEWAVLDWNKPSIEFYRSVGAAVLDDWRMCRLSDAPLRRFAEGAH